MAAEGASPDFGPAPACGMVRVRNGGQWMRKPLDAYPGTWRTWCKDCLRNCDGKPALVTDTVLVGCASGNAKLHVPAGCLE